jgi:phage terminase Nu1 subunit (DNA packaging protein)
MKGKIDSLAQAAAQLGVPVAKLRRAKRLGCDAFRSGRVDLDALRAWLTERQRSGKPSPDDIEPAAIGRAKLQVLRQQARRLRLQSDQREKLLVSRAEVCKAMSRTASRVRELLESRLVQVYPTKLAGLDVPRARAYGRQLNDEILAEFAHLSKLWEF